MVIMLHEVDGGAGAACCEILQQLPTWFGIPEANQHYIDTADASPGVIATLDGDAVGITTVKHHSPYAAEIYLMAVKPAHHRHGVGRRMLERVEHRLAADGFEFLQVKTLDTRRAPTRATRGPERSGSPAAFGHSRSSRRSGIRATRRCSSSRPSLPDSRRSGAGEQIERSVRDRAR